MNSINQVFEMVACPFCRLAITRISQERLEYAVAESYIETCLLHDNDTSVDAALGSIVIW